MDSKTSTVVPFRVPSPKYTVSYIHSVHTDTDYKTWNFSEALRFYNSILADPLCYEATLTVTLAVKHKKKEFKD